MIEKGGGADAMSFEESFHNLKTKRIFVVEDHPLTRQGLIATIASRPEWQVCGEANSAEEALSRMEADQPDLAVVDLLLDEGNGLDLIKEMQARYPRVKILVLSSCEEQLFAERAMRAGAMGYIHKRFALAKIVEAIEKILKGECFLSPELEQRLLSLGVSKRKQVTDDPVQQLSNRELEVFDLIGQGLKSKQIADRLQISVHTVDSHREKIRHKLGLKSGNELMQRAVVWTLKGSAPRG